MRRLLQLNPQEQIPITEQNIKNIHHAKKNYETIDNDLYSKYIKLLKDFNAPISSGEADITLLNDASHYGNTNVNNTNDISTILFLLKAKVSINAILKFLPFVQDLPGNLSSIFKVTFISNNNNRNIFIFICL